MKKMIMTMEICLLLYVTGISAFAQNTEWQCDNCGKYNEYDYNFCGNCGSKKPKQETILLN